MEILTSARPHDPHRRLPARVGLPIGAAVGIGLLLPAALSAAEQSPRTFDIPAGNASATLKQFAAQSNAQLLYSPDDVSGVKTQAVRGELAPLVALKQMLRRTPLKARQDPKTNAIAITATEFPRAAPPTAPQSRQSSMSNDSRSATDDGGPITKRRNPVAAIAGWLSLALFASSDGTAANTPQGGSAASPLAGSQSEASSAIVKMSIFEVSDKSTEGYRSTQTVQASNTLENLRETPNSISVINRELIDDLIAVDVKELSYYMVTGEVSTNAQDVFGAEHVFRGIVGNIALRDGVTVYMPMDTFQIERVEILRGPTAFLYGEGTAGGLINQLTKSALSRNHEKATLIFGSHNLYRAEVDINRRVSDRLSTRVAAAYQHGKSFQHHAGREFKGLFATATYRPFPRTQFMLSAEYQRSYTNLGFNILADQFSTTQRTGATVAMTASTGGFTFIPENGVFVSTLTSRRSTGTGMALLDGRIQSREFNLNGPDGDNRVHFGAISLRASQEVFKNLNLQAIVTYQKADRTARQRGGASSGGIYVDTSATRPDGSQNPRFNQYYTEFYNQSMVHTEPQHNARLTAVYNLSLPFTKQRLIGTFLYHDSEPQAEFYSEIVDPKTSAFNGSLSNEANTLEAYRANRTAHSQNYFYRRFYIADGDRAEITKKQIVVGRSIMMRDTVVDGANGRLADEFYRTPGFGFGASGSYFGDRLHSLIGWRRSSFNVSRGRDFFNYVTGLTYRVDSIPGLAQPNVIRITEDAINYGGVVDMAKFVSAYFNYAESMALSSGVGAPQLVPNVLRGPGLGDGNEYGLRWSLWGGKLESNWTYYITNQRRVNANPAIPAAVRQIELGSIFGADINVAGGDVQSTRSTGFEFETTANITTSWRLMWNYSTNKLATANRYPSLKYFQKRAKDEGKATPETDAFLATVPDGTPLPGFNKVRSNLVMQYRFTDGPFKGISIGGGGQYRDVSYRGNFDLNRDGVAEKLWSPGYTIWNASVGYRTKIRQRTATLMINVNNVLDKHYYRSYSLSSAGWEDGRSLRFSLRLDN